MNPDRWKQLERAFYQYDELDGDARRQFMDELEASDPALRSELAEMVSEQESSSQFLDPPSSASGLGLAPDAMDERIESGTRLGAYRVLDWIASGGMGAVYRAERADQQFEQTVAIKVLKAGAANPALRQRFHQERQTLAMLNHPHVAKLLDGGDTDDGLPYLVMEYVDGQPIDRYCDENELSVEERLRLFVTVCDAVHHLHQNLVVHRDIKPNNILVDSDGRPKLLDFGISKVLDVDARAEDIDATMPGVRLMTPQFASPEQVRGDVVTTATDIYSLGILLYRLLCGQEPFELGDGPLHEFERAVCETDPLRPSTAVRRAREDGDPTTTTSDGIARQRGTSVDRLRRRLSGDLDTVVLMAMQKKPSERYGSAQQFGEDVQCVLDHRPVIARRTPVVLRLFKFAQRNRLGAALAVALLVSMLAGAGGILWWAGRTQDESLRADREADTARIEAESVRKLNRFLNEMLTSVQPGVLGADARVRDVLDRAAARLTEEALNEPSVESGLRVTLGRSYLGLGELDLAEVQFEAAVSIARTAFSVADRKLAQVLGHLARMRIYLDELDEAEELLEEASACFDPESGDGGLASVLATQAEVAHARRDLSRAEELYRRAIAIRRALPSRHDSDLPSTMTGLAKVLANGPAPRHGEAEELLREAIDLERRRYPEDHPNISNKKVELAFVLHRTGAVDQALELAQAGYRDMAASFGEENLSVVPSLNLLASLHLDQGDLGTAEELLRDALRVLRGAGHAGSSSMAYTLSTLASVLNAKGDAAGTIECFAEALEIREKVRGDSDPEVAYLAESLCVAQRRSGDLVGAKASAEKALEINRRAFGDSHLAVAGSLLMLGHVERVRADVEAAESHYLRVIELADELGAPAASDGLDAVFWLAMVRKSDGRPAEAAPLFRRVAVALEADEPPPLDRLSLVWSRIADCLVAMNDVTAAEEVLLSGYRRTSEAAAPDAEPNRTLRESLALLYRASGRPEEAAAYE